MSFDWLNAKKPPAAPAVGPRKWIEAPRYEPGDELVTALNMAMALDQPLLVTGEPGCGKTSAAYWAAWRMGLDHEDVIHETVRSDASAARLKYEFDHVRYFRDAQVAAARAAAESMRAAMQREPLPALVEALDRGKYIDRGPLWRAFEPVDPSVGGEDHGRDTVLLLDEIRQGAARLPQRPPARAGREGARHPRDRADGARAGSQEGEARARRDHLERRAAVAGRLPATVCPPPHRDGPGPHRRDCLQARHAAGRRAREGARRARARLVPRAVRGPGTRASPDARRAAGVDARDSSSGGGRTRSRGTSRTSPSASYPTSAPCSRTRRIDRTSEQGCA